MKKTLLSDEELKQLPIMYQFVISANEQNYENKITVSMEYISVYNSNVFILEHPNKPICRLVNFELFERKEI